MGRFGRFLVEYVGNLDHSRRDDAKAPPKPVDRRRNRHARELMDWIKRQMDARGLPATKKHEMVDNLRRALSQESAAQVGVRMGEATDERPPTWMADAVGDPGDEST